MTAHKKDKPAEPEPASPDPNTALLDAVNTIGEAVRLVIGELQTNVSEIRNDQGNTARLNVLESHIGKALAILNKTMGAPT